MPPACSALRTARPDFMTEHVGHSGHALGEAPDAVASLA